MFKFRGSGSEMRGPVVSESALDLELTTPLIRSGRQARPPDSVMATRPLATRPLSGLAPRLKLIAPIIASVLLSIVGQLILKTGMSELGPISLTARNPLEIIWSLATNLFVVIGVFIFAGSVLCWLVGLSRVPLSYAYPFISLSYVVILAASYFLLGEPVSLARVIGVLIICAGVLLVAYS